VSDQGAIAGENSTLIPLAADIVSAFVSNNSLPAADLATSARQDNIRFCHHLIQGEQGVAEIMGEGTVPGQTGSFPSASDHLYKRRTLEG
jgi:hypothetical protein